MDITQRFSAHDLAYYARELARAVQVFYKNVPVLRADVKVVKSRLQLVLAARTVLGKVLDLLKISKPDIM
jgi:arginyl-tRNA synthetase